MILIGRSLPSGSPNISGIEASVASLGLVVGQDTTICKRETADVPFSKSVIQCNPLHNLNTLTSFEAF
jgi:hypothetical protein